MHFQDLFSYIFRGSDAKELIGRRFRWRIENQRIGAPTYLKFCLPLTHTIPICVSKCLCILYLRPGIDFLSFYSQYSSLYIYFLYGYRILFVIQDCYMKNEKIIMIIILCSFRPIFNTLFLCMYEYYIKNISWYIKSGKFNFQSLKHEIVI